MQRLFEGKKAAYTPNDLHMEATRIRSLRNKIFFYIEFSFLFF